MAARDRSARRSAAAIASGLSGPRRMAAGAARDFVLGARSIDGRGQHLSFGGRVMKNVAGYDVSRALAGSLGTLGVVTEVSLKVLPMPAVTRDARVRARRARRRSRKLNEWAGQPLADHRQRVAVAARGSRRGADGPARRQRGRGAVGHPPHRRTRGRRRRGRRASGATCASRRIRYFATRPVDASQWRLALPTTSPPLDAARSASPTS